MAAISATMTHDDLTHATTIDDRLRTILKDVKEIKERIDHAHANIVNMDHVNALHQQEPARRERCLSEMNIALDDASLHEGNMLEIGGRSNPLRDEFSSFHYTAIDMAKTGNDVIVADITSCPQIPDNSFDFIVSIDVLEHVAAPWRAAAEITRILRPGGVTYHTTLFSWRYHPCPIDYWRYTPEALKFLFSDLHCLRARFDYAERRRNMFGPAGKNQLKPDVLGGWRENVRVHYAGRKI